VNLHRGAEGPRGPVSPRPPAMRRSQWTDPGASTALCWLAIEAKRTDVDGEPLHTELPQSLYSEAIAPFLHFDSPLPDQLYVVGGRNQQQDPLSTVEMFDTWHGRWVVCPDMSACRAGCATAVLPDGRLLVVGGYDERGIVTGVLGSCEAFDPARQAWDPRLANLQRPRWGHGCAALNGRVFAVGGCALRHGDLPGEEMMETLRSCEVYDPEADTWSECAGLHVARAGARIVVVADNLLAAVGGCDDVFGRAEMLASVELFDLGTARWNLLDAQLSIPRTTAAAVALDGRTILVMGGAPSLASVEVYSMPKKHGGNSQREEGAREQSVSDMKEGRMGCQAVTMRLPAPHGSYPLCARRCVVVVGGENGDEALLHEDWDSEQAPVRQFSSVLVYDTEASEWRPECAFPPIPTPRTAMALCVAPGRIRGHR